MPRKYEIIGKYHTQKQMQRNVNQERTEHNFIWAHRK